MELGAVKVLPESMPYSSTSVTFVVRSIAAVASKKKVPIFCPAIMDSAFGESFLLAANKGNMFC